jgi:alpha-glucuronidase
MNNKQLIGLNKSSIKKSKEALIRTEKAIATLSNKEQEITIRAVAREARVSVSYIYKYPELAYKIQCLREQQKYSLVVSDRSPKKTERKIKILQLENTELKQQIAELKAIIEGENKRKDLKIENLQLATENIKLRKELKYALQSLQEAREFILEQR